jgi:hypothetical protein
MGSAKDQRISETLMQNLAESMPRERPSPALKRERKRGGIAAKRGYFERQYQPGTGETTGGIAGPLTEEDITKREYYDPLMSSDGLFALPQIKVMVLTDADGLEVKVELADPATLEEEP